MGMNRYIITLFILALPLFLFAERQTSISIYNVFMGSHNLTNSILSQAESDRFLGEVAVQITGTPSLSYQDNFQSDGKLNLFFTKFYDTNYLDISIREAYIDFLFFNSFSIKSGFQSIDYGYNSYFHPLNIIEFVPEFRNIYNKITLGNAPQGYKGVPSIKFSYTVPEFMESLKLTLEQSMCWFNNTNLMNNYYISMLNTIYGNYSLGILSGYYGNSFTTNKDRTLPVYGINVSAGLPWNIYLFAECLYKQESYRYLVVDEAITNKRENTGFYNGTVRLELTHDSPIFTQNTFTFQFEYFYYGEGYTKKSYDSAYQFISNSSLNLYTYGPQLLMYERNFINNIYTSFTYNIKDWISLSYVLKMEVEPQTYYHEFDLMKVFDQANASIRFSLVYISFSEEKYRIVTGAQNWQGYLSFYLDI